LIPDAGFSASLLELFVPLVTAGLPAVDTHYMAPQALACPYCRTWFEASGHFVRCPSCGRRFEADKAHLGVRDSSIARQLEYTLPERSWSLEDNVRPEAPHLDAAATAPESAHPEVAAMTPRPGASTGDMASDHPRSAAGAGGDAGEASTPPSGRPLDDGLLVMGVPVQYVIGAVVLLYFFVSPYLPSADLLLGILLLIGMAWLYVRRGRGDN
jgi:hypothetical protein